jgi:hypothetical protein
MPKTQPLKYSVTAFTGLTRCWYCGGRYHVGTTKGAKRYYMCYNRVQHRNDCPAKSAVLSSLEDQMGEYLRTFYIPNEYQQMILSEHQRLTDAYGEAGRKRPALVARSERAKKLFMWGDIDEAEYMKEKRAIELELQALKPIDDQSLILQRLADFLRDISKAWANADPAQRNRLLRELFDEICIQDGQIIGVRPAVEFEPFFKLSFDRWLREQQFELAAQAPSPATKIESRGPSTRGASRFL